MNLPEMKIKVCGMREPGNIGDVAQLPIDYMGFIFYEKSLRYVSNNPLMDVSLPDTLRRVGVFVDAPEETILQKVQDFKLTTVQLHGSETPALAASLKNRKLEVIKVFNISEETDLLSAIRYEGVCDYFLFDTKTPLRGGSGESFEWTILEAYCGKTPFFLSGGIGANDVSRLRTFRHPRWQGIDLNSRFEHAPANKNTSLLSIFINQLKNNTAS